MRSRWSTRGAWLALAIATGSVWLALGLLPRPLLANRTSFSQVVLARDGSLLRLSLANDEAYRLWTPLEEIPQHVVDATLLQEDRWFFWHPGVNPVSLGRALFRSYVRGDRRRGASTLSMQLARMRYGLATRSPRGKLVQILRALELELCYSKREILEAYLNLAPYGGNVQGVGAAAWVWLGKPPGRLERAEALALAVIPKSPRARSPYTESGRLELARAARALAARAGEPALADVLASVRWRSRAELPFRAPHLVDRLLAEHAGVGRLVAALDPALQERVERAVRSFVAHGRTYGMRNAAVLLLDARSGEALAYAGSADHAEVAIEGAVDGVRAPRSPGSALKPFIYGLALDAGLIHPESLVEDAPSRVSAWNPENFDGEFLGPLSARDALVRSRNVPAVQLARALPGPGLYGLLARSGVRGLRAPEFYGLALALGGSEIRLDELVSLYAALARGGRAVAPRLLADEPAAGEAVQAPRRAQRAGGERSLSQLLSPEASALVLDMLRGNPRPGRPWLRTAAAGQVAWKTGTSYGFRDAWAVGVFGRFALGVWVGNFDGTPNRAFVGRDAAGPLFFAIVDALRRAGESIDPPRVARALSLVSVSVCSVSGARAHAFCPGRKQALVIPGRSPIASCSIHREIAIDTASGRRACPGQLAGVRRAVYEFWPSHVEALFRAVGIARRVPPAFAAHCGERSVAGAPLRIASPVAGLVYVLRDGRSDVIPLAAVADADAERVSWFVDDRFVGQTAPGGTHFWPARPGRFVLRAVDALGRSRTQPLEVALASDGRAP